MCKLLGGLSVLLLSLIAVTTVMPSSAVALSGSEFNPGRIIDDGVFFNPNTIDPNTVQVFLNSKVPSCDTNGTQPYGSGTRAQYATSRGYPPPYTCLRNYTQDTPSRGAETGLCNAYNGGAKSAARIIYDVSQACGINPKVLIVLLEKEQSLVTDDWPWSIQYRSATGYGCPDTAPCDSDYYGFFNQVYNAARQFKKYARDSTLFRYRAGRDNYIQYNPNAGCSGTNVFIQNQATAGLYNFTPYQPNPSALANLYGSGDGCGAYGNRNFWRLFNDWFGSTTNANCVFPAASPGGIYRLYNKGTGNHLLTTNPSEVCVATSIGYMYDGQILKEEAGQGKPVYRLERGGRYLFTDNIVERDSAVNQHGFKFEGVAFNGVDSALNPQTSRPVYRLVSQSGTYLYTLSSYERDAMVGYGYRYEGVSFNLYENPGAAVAPVYRLSHPSGIYLFTLSATERDNASQIYGYRSEGIGFNSITQLNPITVPVYRLASSKGYVLTTNLLERINASNLGYRDEGIAMYTYGTMTDPNLNKAYRLAGQSGTYLYTPSAIERDVAAKDYGYRFEGIGFLTP